MQSLRSRIAFTSLSLLLLSAGATAQPGYKWAARYSAVSGSQLYGKAVAVDTANDVYVAAMSYTAATNADFVLIKYSPDGSHLWTRRFNDGYNGYDAPAALAVDAAGNAYVAGVSFDGASYDYMTVKYSPDGAKLWQRDFGRGSGAWAHVSAIVVDTQGNAIVTGSLPGLGPNSVYLTIKYAPDGTRLWARSFYGNRQGNTASAVAVNGLGDVFVTGTSSDGAAFAYATVKYNADGDRQWIRRYSGAGHGAVAWAIAADDAGGAVVTGAVIVNGPQEQYGTVRYDAAGNKLWEIRYGATANNTTSIPRSVAIDGSGNVYVGGITGPANAGPYNYATVMYDANGQHIWTRVSPGPGAVNYLPTPLAICPDGCVVATGSASLPQASTGSGAQQLDYEAVKYDNAGKREWARRYSLPGAKGSVMATTVDSTGAVIVTGTAFNPTTGSYDVLTVKYAP